MSHTRTRTIVRYVAGFLIAGQQVLLLRKSKPEWQAGKLNGVGGKIEVGELPADAMVREFREETGITEELAWHERVVLSGQDGSWRVAFFVAEWPGSGPPPQQTVAGTDEPAAWYLLHNLYHLPVIGNLRWLVPLCMDPEIVAPVHVVDQGRA